MSRIFGGRDLALGVVLLQALREERPEAVTRALLLGAGCDAWDAVAALRGRELPIWGRLVVATLGSTFAALGASAAFAPPRRLRASSPSGRTPTTVDAGGDARTRRRRRGPGAGREHWCVTSWDSPNPT